MPVSICPRCKHFNPEYAVYCYFDGVVLQAQQHATPLRLPNEFMFPSGRRCRTFDDLAQGCQEEWSAARDLLLRGAFAQFFGSCNRADLVRAANDARAQTNPDIGLTTFLNALPGTRTQTPKLDLNPRRILLGNLVVGEAKSVPLTITNQGQGMLQGTLTVTEGQDWVSVGDKPSVHEIEISTVREQTFKLAIKTSGLSAGQTYGAKLTVVTNGGVVEVPLRMELIAQPFTKAPFQGVRSQRELAEVMRQQPKAAVPILESGEVQRWFQVNGWTFPVRGAQVKGVGGVQQFFEGMGVSKPPPVSLSKTELRFTCKYKDTVRAQATLQTPVKKWVYGTVTSDSLWLKVPQPQVAGPQHATIPFEIDTSLWNLGALGEGTLTVEANGGQKVTLKVIVEVVGAPEIPKPRGAPAPVPSPVAPGPPPVLPRATVAPPAAAPTPAGFPKIVPAFVTTVLVCLAFRIVLIPFVDLVLRPEIARAAAQRLKVPVTDDSPLAGQTGWLELPWVTILAADTTLPAKFFQPRNQADLETAEYRHYFVSYFVRWFALGTGWVGAIIGAVWILRRGGGPLDIPWGIIAGIFAGFAASATLAAFFLIAEFLPHAVWRLAVGSHSGWGFLALWEFFAIVCWLAIGVFLGIVLPWIAPLRRVLIDPFQSILALGFRATGNAELANYWAPV